MAEPLTNDDLVTMEQAARRFSGAYTGTSGTLAGYVILLLKELRRLQAELQLMAVAKAMKENLPRCSYED